jgi:hypothetical protein
MTEISRRAFDAAMIAAAKSPLARSAERSPNIARSSGADASSSALPEANSTELR